MAIDVYDAVRVRRRRIWMWTAAAALCAGIMLAAGRAARLIGGFVDGLTGLLRRMLF